MIFIGWGVIKILAIDLDSWLPTYLVHKLSNLVH